MKLLLSGHHLELTPAMRSYVEEKLERIRRHFEQVLEIEVILALEESAEKEKRQIADINLRVKNETMRAHAEAEDVYAAIDLAVEKLDRQLARFKGKLQDHQHIPSKHLQ